MLAFYLVAAGWILLAAWAVTRKTPGRSPRNRRNSAEECDLAALRRRQSDGRITPEMKKAIVREILRRQSEPEAFQ